MYLKFIGCLLVLIGCTLIGFFMGENLKKRFVQLKEIEQALYQLQGEIIYSHSALPEIFTNVSIKANKPISQLFKDVAKLLQENKVNSVYEAFKESFNINKVFLNINESDIGILMDLSKSLGESDIEGQKNIINLTIKSIRSQLDEAEKSIKNNIKMYRYLGFSLGAILVIMII